MITWLKLLFKTSAIDEFIRLLASTPRTWELMDLKRIRTSLDSEGPYGCPITAVAHHLRHGQFKLADYRSAGLALGLSNIEAMMIANAADINQGVLYDKRLRRRLLKACGLKETA